MWRSMSIDPVMPMLVVVIFALFVRVVVNRFRSFSSLVCGFSWICRSFCLGL